MRVGVVGAGLAGLSCAWWLHRHGHEVVVLEARDRVGGRTWSEELPNGVVVERGGEWIDADQHTIRRFCAELGLPLAPHGVRFHRRRVAGTVRSLADLEHTLARVRAALPEQAYDDASLAQAFADALGDGWATDPTYLRIATSTAGDPDRASARFHVARAETGRIDGAARVVGGNQRIALALAAALGDRVRTGVPVGEVEHDADGAALTTTRGERLEVDRVVVAIPLALLDEIAWEPGFPEQWRPGLGRMATGTAAKLSVPTASTATPDGVQDPGLPWWSWNSLDAAGDTGVAAVSCFAGGDAARTALRVGEGPAAWVDAVAAQRPDLDLQPDGALLTDWAGDPWTRGGYSYVLACPTSDPHEPDVEAALQRPAGRLVLAGEYTAGAASGTMEGALLSGVRAARTIDG